MASPFLTKWRTLPLQYESWILDSGAWSVWNAGGSVDIEDYIRTCHEVLESDTPPRQIFALDVIGDWEASLRNTERMWEAGIEATPTFHHGEPWDVLLRLAEEYPRIAIGGVAGSPNYTKMSFAKGCFSRVWPKQIHGFAYCSPSYVEAYPFTSVDSTSWFLQPIRYHRHKGFEGAHLRNSKTKNLKGEVDFYLDLQQKARFRWRKQMGILGVEVPSPTLYLAHPGLDTLTGYELQETA